MTKYQDVNLQSVLGCMKNMKTFASKMDYLRGNYPCLALFLMNKGGMKNYHKRYMEHCKTFKDYDVFNYSAYVHGYFLPMLQ